MSSDEPENQSPPQPRAVAAADIKQDDLDYAGHAIVCVYAYNPPHYAVYRTTNRVMIHFADDGETAATQRARIACLTPLRGQIGALIDGWHTARDRLAGMRGKPEDNALRKRAARYDRRVGDAIILGLENDVTTALALLAEIKNDIINERTSIARTDYLLFALMFAVLFIIAAGVLGRPEVAGVLRFPAEAGAVWTAVAGGTLGAFFSIAIGLKGRTVLIDLQNRDNLADAFLRMLIGSVAGGMLLCLLVSGLVSDVIAVDQLTPGGGEYKHVLVFVIGFLAGFFERLVPDLLSETNLGTKEGAGTPGTSASTPPPAQPSPLPTPSPSPRPAGEDGRKPKRTPDVSSVG